MNKALLIIYVYCQTRPEWTEPTYAYSIGEKVTGPFDGLETIASSIKSEIPQITGARADIICAPPTDMHVIYGKAPVKHEPLSKDEEDKLFEELHWK